MHLGKVPGGGFTLPKSSPKSAPADNLDEVVVSAKYMEPELPEIVVSARKIPWYAWAAVGVALASLVTRR